MHINPHMHKHMHRGQTKITYSKTQHMLNPPFLSIPLLPYCLSQPWERSFMHDKFYITVCVFFIHPRICRWCRKINERMTSANPVDVCLLKNVHAYVCKQELTCWCTHVCVLPYKDCAPIPRVVFVFVCSEYVCMQLSKSFHRKEAEWTFVEP